MISPSNTTDDIGGRQIQSLLPNWTSTRKHCYSWGAFLSPFDAATVTMITRFIAAAVGKIYKLRAERLRELEAPWLSHYNIVLLTLFRFVTF